VRDALLGYPLTAVSDGHQRLIAFRACGDVDRRSLGRELLGVVEKRRHDLFEPRDVDHRRREIRRDVDVEQMLTATANDALEDRMKIGPLYSELQDARFDV
jgi:hypothetical protein